MTLQIDSLAISGDETKRAEETRSADEARTHQTKIDSLDEQVAALDARILSAVERRTELVRKLAQATGDVQASTETTSFDGLGSDGSVISRMLARIASVTA